MTDATRNARRAWTRALEQQGKIAANPRVLLADVIDDFAESQGDAPALISREETVNYAELAARANRCARWAIAEGLVPGDAVCLLMPNRPDYLAIWLGLGHVGVAVALLNTSLSGDALAHCIRIAAPKRLIVDASLAEVAISADAADVPVSIFGSSSTPPPEKSQRRLDLEVAAFSGARLRADEGARPSLSDRALYIYTSGTTGLPKAANVSHRRVMQWSRWFCGMMNVAPADRMYHCLPMYHSVGGVVATGAVLAGGGSIFLRPRFSASAFWDEVSEQGCTLFQYIGELCRYLLAAPPHPLEKSHPLRLCCGNGLSKDVWEAFSARFGEPPIIEFYAATEGNVSLYNCEGRPGAIGRIPAFLAHSFPIALIRSDAETGEPMRGGDGLCIPCEADEPGEALGRIADSSRFEGYADGAATKKKILRDVLAPGEAWFRTGDLMRKDAEGFFYFVDRIGDTFRWKGENVSTAEVSAALCACPGVSEAVVYGVAIPGADGRAGMAALTTTADFSMAALTSGAAARLPEYARPLFLRLCGSIETTGTFKPIKRGLISDGFDPSASDDQIFVFDRARSGYAPLDRAGFERIASGSVRW